MHHWRRGMVGAVLDWAEGSEADAATLVLMLIEELELQDVLREKLKPSQDTRGAETDTFIVDRIEKALAVLKSCATEQQQQDYADGTGSPILAGPFTEQTTWPPKENEPTWLPEYRGIARLRYDAGDCALLPRRYYHRVPDDPEGLTFVREEAQATEKLVINSSELRAVQGKITCNITLVLINPPRLRQQPSRNKKGPRVAEALYDRKQRWHIDAEVDSAVRCVCEVT